MLEDRLNIRTRFAFGAGGMPETLKNTAWDMFVLFYFTQVLGLSGSLAGLAIAISLVVDSVIDPTIGSYSDGMRGSRLLARRQTLMAFSVLPFGIAFTMLFCAPASLGPWGLFAWLVVFAIISRAAISLFTIPYYALTVELSRSPLERPLLAAFRQVSTAIGRFSLPFFAFTFFFAATAEFPNGQLNGAAYPYFAVFFSFISMALMTWCILGTNRRSRAIERHLPDRPATPLSLKTTVLQIIEAFRCTPNVRRQVLLGMFMFISLGILNVYTLHLTTYYWRLTPEEIRNVSIALSPGTLIAALGARYFVPRFDKRKLMMTCIMLYGLAVLVPVLGPMTPFFPGVGESAQVPMLIAFKFMAGLTYGAFLVTTGTVGSDVADELELNAGAPRQALMSSFTFFMFGAASALVNVAAGVFLDLVEFPIGAPVAEVPEALAANLALFTAAIIAVSVMCVIVLISRLDISAAKQREINRLLTLRYAAAEPTAEPAAPATTTAAPIAARMATTSPEAG